VTTTRFVILVVTYLLIAVQRVPYLRLNRPSAALLGAVAMVTIGRLPLHDAYAAIDLDVMVFLLGVLLITGVSRDRRILRVGSATSRAPSTVGASVARSDCRGQRTPLGVFRQRHDLPRSHAARTRGAAAALLWRRFRFCSQSLSGPTSAAR
jgi:hypothetical protein